MERGRQRSGNGRSGFSLRPTSPAEEGQAICAGISNQKRSAQEAWGLEDIIVSRAKKLNIVANKNLPLPKIVKIPVLNMKLHYNNLEKIARVLLDSGSSVPILSDTWAIRNQTPVAERENKRPIRDYAGHEVPGSGQFFTSPLPLQL